MKTLVPALFVVICAANFEKIVDEITLGVGVVVNIISANNEPRLLAEKKKTEGQYHIERRIIPLTGDPVRAEIYVSDPQTGQNFKLKMLLARKGVKLVEAAKSLDLVYLNGQVVRVIGYANGKQVFSVPIQSWIPPEDVVLFETKLEPTGSFLFAYNGKSIPKNPDPVMKSVARIIERRK